MESPGNSLLRKGREFSLEKEMEIGDEERRKREGGVRKTKAERDFLSRNPLGTAQNKFLFSGEGQHLNFGGMEGWKHGLLFVTGIQPTSLLPQNMKSSH